MMYEGRYAVALSVATEAAAEAAAILLAECGLPGGPRGWGGHCDADTEAENAIRARLEAAFPVWGYLGEETGRRRGTDPEGHVWLVDPNDGTSAMLQGHRGHAVSIGLLRDGLPVLGVVHAVDAPDDAGDVIAWAEGCGPLTRNGVPVPPQAWPEALGPEHVVLVSQAADRYPIGNLRMVAPARIRATASIAYRLALVAVGEGVAGVSLMGPGAWDYGGAHALLRAQGGVLMDENGEEVRYSREGQSTTSMTFGGGEAVVRELLKRPWYMGVKVASLGDAEPPSGFGPARLHPGSMVHDIGVLRRAQGAWLGQLAGDSLGALVEFQSPHAIARAYPDGGPRLLASGGTWHNLAGQATDDSELAMLLARSIVDRGGFEQEAVAQAYVRWCQGRSHESLDRCGHRWCEPFDIGGTTSKALRAPRGDDLRSGRAAEATQAAADPESQANGALMRVSPIGIWGWNKPLQRVMDAARADARISHPSSVCQEASALFAATIAFAVREGPTPQEAFEWAASLAQRSPEPAIARTLERARARPPEDFMHQQGWVLLALQNAFYRLLHAPTLEQAVVDTVRAGGDTDTNAAICGALLGAVHGRTAIPEQWRLMVTSCRPWPPHAPIRHPRPAQYWPADALILAERLLLG